MFAGLLPILARIPLRKCSTRSRMKSQLSACGARRATSRLYHIHNIHNIHNTQNTNIHNIQILYI
jgi:hypothetical protein